MLLQAEKEPSFFDELTGEQLEDEWESAGGDEDALSLELFERMQARGIAPDHAAYGAAVAACAESVAPNYHHGCTAQSGS